jgi:hypothetical protein
MVGRPELGEITQTAQTPVFAISEVGLWSMGPSGQSRPLPVPKFPRNDITDGRAKRSRASAASDHRKRGT